MRMKNIEIYNRAQNLIQAFNDDNQKLPIKVNFYLSKNKKAIVDLAQEIDKARIDIASTYGVFNQDTQEFEIPPEKTELASNELRDLFDLEQEVDIYPIPFSNLSDDLSLTTGQMEAIMFMIQE